MTLYQFNSLSSSQQKIALRKAVFIADREDARHNIHLFQLTSFYIEVYYHKQIPALNHYKSFSGTDQLEPYLDKMDLDF